jgi:hypothetical protein
MFVKLIHSAKPVSKQACEVLAVIDNLLGVL